MNKYSTPKVEITEIECQDIIQTSGLIDGGTGSNPGDSGDSSVWSGRNLFVK